MSRILVQGDFLPDFEFQDAQDTRHTASLAGKGGLLIFLGTGMPMQSLGGLMSAVKDVDKIGTVVLAPGSSSGLDHGAIAPAEGISSLDNPQVWGLVYGDEVDASLACVFAYDIDLKILKRVHCGADRLESVVRTLAAECQAQLSAARAPVVPVLKIRSALSPDFCKELIQYHQDSENKIQGRAGLYSPVINTAVKRAVHVNAHRELCQAIDRAFIFSLLPAVERVYDYRITHRVSYKISHYSASDQGFFAAHRDNTDAGSLFRKFALSVCLNEDWEGGGLCFPEYSSEPVSLATGDALVFPVSLMHRVEPIQSGERYVLLSFMYDDQGAIDRRASMDNPSILDDKYIDAIDRGMLDSYHAFAPSSRYSPQYKGGY
jgi:predicted 2-oxoglutarate/Fe(II)-dependent dioxygenase YbiX